MADKTTPGTPAWLRARNDRTAFQFLLERGPLTRNQLGELTGLSKPTASQMVQRLESADLISAAGAISAGRGPNAATYAVRGDQALGVAIDIDATRTRSTLVDVTGAPHEIAENVFSATGHPPVEVVRRAIDTACMAADVEPGRIGAVCLAVQGSVDPRTDELRFADTLGDWPRHAVRSRIADDLHVDVTIENDVNLAAVAERSVGAGADLGGFTLLWLGEGLGVAIDLGGRLQRGTSGGAGEIGYLPAPRAAADLDPDARDLQDLIGGEPVRCLTEQAGGAAADYAQALQTLAEDAVVRRRVVEALAPRVALGIVPVLALIDPERIVLGGPTGSVCGQELATAVAAQVARTTQWTADVAATGVPELPVLTGARTMLQRSLRASLFERLDRLSP